MGIYFFCDVGGFPKGRTPFAGSRPDRSPPRWMGMCLAHAPSCETGRISEEAIDQFNKMIGLRQPDSIDALYSLSYALEQEGRIPEAIAQIKAALDLHPRDPELLARRIDLENAQRQQAKPPARAPVLPK